MLYAVGLRVIFWKYTHYNYDHYTSHLPIPNILENLQGF